MRRFLCFIWSSLCAAAFSLPTDSVDLPSLSPAGVSALLADWHLDAVFAAKFEAVKLDGDALAFSTEQELRDAFPEVPGLHWSRLFRKLQPLRIKNIESGGGPAGFAADSKKVGVPSNATPSPITAEMARSQHRVLQDALDIDFDGYSGVIVAQNESLVKFGSDMAIVRTPEGLTVIAPKVSVTGDLDVSGAFTIQGDELAAADSTQPYGKSGATAATSCRAILQRDSSAKSGTYFLNRLRQRSAYAAYCDMDRGGLELIFKISHGVGGDAVDLWETTDGVNEEKRTMNLLQNDNYCAANKQDVWDDDGFMSIHAHIMQGNRLARYITFDPSGSDSSSWFSADYAVASDWIDLLSEDKNFFSINGDETYGRNWFVNGNYGGCGVDAGWMVLDDEYSDPCDWEVVNNGPSGAIDILYSPLTTIGNADDDWIQADAFAVLVDVDTVYKSCQHALSFLDYEAQDGQYWVNHNNNTSPHLVYCDMESGGYELVFKVVHGGLVDDAYALWSDSVYDTSPLSGQNADPVTWVEHYGSPFRHTAFDLDITVSDVDVRIVTDGDVQKYMHFVLDSDADSESWFSKTYLQGSSWTDIFTEDVNFFSIEGDGNNDRGWFVNSNYGGCSVDAGWLAIAGAADGVCTWEDSEEQFPDIRYSRLKTKDEADTYGVADLMAVFYLWN